MVQTISHRFNTHFKRLSLSASVVIIIITRLLATSRIITQYFNHLLLFNFTTSPFKIDKPLSTFQFCHLYCNHLDGEERADCFALFFFLVSRDG